jgi:hypothetical protein
VTRSLARIRAARSLLACTLVLGTLVAASFAGCGGSGETCDCTSPQVTITVPADIAASITAVTFSGPACTGVVASPPSPNGGTSYDFTANAAGECDIEVDKPSGNFTQTLTFIAQTGCCPGFYSSTLSIVQVPEPEDGG